MRLGTILLLLCTAGQVGPREGLVTDAEVEVLDAPEPGALPTGVLGKGQKVVVVRDEPGGWLAIRPPAGSFSYIDRDAVAAGDDGQARVIAAEATVRPGRPGARLPGAGQAILERGAIVRLLDQPPLTAGSGPSARQWLAIEPPPGELRFVAADGVEVVGASRPPARPVDALDDDPAVSPSPPLDPLLREEIRRAEALHRATVSLPVAQWDLERVRSAYSDLLQRGTDDATRDYLRERLVRVERQADVARSASGFLTRLRVSRARDDDLRRFRQTLERVGGAAANRFVADGLLEPSSEELEGQRLYALIGKDGKLSAYLDLPAGLGVRPLIGRRVGVIGEARYLEALPVRLIAVSDLEPLDRPPTAPPQGK